MAEARTNRARAASEPPETPGANTGEAFVSSAGGGAPASEPFIVDGQAVSEDAYYKAAEGTYDVQRLKEMNYRPAISTKKHGE